MLPTYQRRDGRIVRAQFLRERIVLGHVQKHNHRTVRADGEAGAGRVVGQALGEGAGNGGSVEEGGETMGAIEQKNPLLHLFQNKAGQ